MFKQTACLQVSDLKMSADQLVSGPIQKKKIWKQLTM